jgi:hypothetical protein
MAGPIGQMNRGQTAWAEEAAVAIAAKVKLPRTFSYALLPLHGESDHLDEPPALLMLLLLLVLDMLPT